MKLALSLALLVAMVGPAIADVPADRRIPRPPVNLASQDVIKPAGATWNAFVFGLGGPALWPPQGVFSLKYAPGSPRPQLCTVLFCFPILGGNKGLPARALGS